MNRELKKWVSKCIPPTQHSGAYFYYWDVFNIKYRPTRVEIYLYADGIIYMTVRDFSADSVHYDEKKKFTLKTTDWKKKEVIDQIMGILAIIEIHDA